MIKKIVDKLLIVIVLVVSCTILCACGDMKINFDVVGNDTLATSTINNINNDPPKYKNKTLRVWGKFKGNEDYYTLNENNTCCRWTFEVKMGEGVSAPKSGTNVTLSGTCIVNKVNGRTEWYLLVSKVE